MTADDELRTAQRFEVANTSAGAVVGNVVQAGMIAGDVNLRTGVPVRTRYREQVRRIAPSRLVGRGAELAELAEFCTSASTVCPIWTTTSNRWTARTAGENEYNLP